MSDSGAPVRIDDLRGCSFERFVTYAFDRPLPSSAKAPSWWHDDGDVDVELLVDPELQLAHATTLFTEPLILRGRFNPAKIDQGFWFLAFGHASDYGRFFVELLWDERVDPATRCACVAAMFDLYEKLFSPFPAETATYMWWDLIASFIIESVFRDEVVPHPVESHERVRLEMVSTLTRILALEPRHCREAALHGLNHVATADERSPVIESFLREWQVDDKLRAYALECLAGRAQ